MIVFMRKALLTEFAIFRSDYPSVRDNAPLANAELTVALSCLALLAIVVAQLEQVLQNDVERYGDGSLDSHACDCNIAKRTTSGQSDDEQKSL